MASRIVLAVLLCLGAPSLTRAVVKLADFVTPCSLKDPKLDECMTTQGRALLPHLVAGVREWGILSLNPLLVPKMELQSGNGGSVGLSIDLHNVKIYGWDTLKIKEIKFNPKTFDLQATFFCPAYILLSEYEIKGRILLLPIVGSGPSNITFVNFDVQMTTHLEVEEKGGKKYLKVVDFKTVQAPQNIMFKMENLFNNKQLGDQMTLFLNENSLDVYAELKTSSENIVNDIILSLISRLLNKIPLKQLFKDVD